MATAAPLRQGQQLVNEVAERYRRLGYSVHIEPSAQELPAFLNGYRPDLIVEGQNESVVVEIKAAGTVDSARWRAIAESVQNQPRWRFEIVAASPDEVGQPASFSEEEVRDRLDRADRSASWGAADAALLVAWSAAEAAMRLAGDKHRVELPDDRPGTLITRLYTDGLLDREDYDLLLSALDQRNAVAHGYRREVVPQDVARLRSVAERLLGE